jgi:hypothetical protein
MTTSHQQSTNDWGKALLWGFGVALAHRILLGIWMAGVWRVGGAFFAPYADFQTPGDSILPPLEGANDIVFGVWRRWDAIHYLNIALNGYIPSNESLSVFPPLTSWSIRAFSNVLRVPIDLGAMIFSTLAFGLALTFLYRLCQVYLKDEALAPWAVALTALFPLGHFFSAPMSEGIYLAMTLGTFYFAARGNFWVAALCGFLATSARMQGVLLAPLALLLYAQQTWDINISWRVRVNGWLRKAYPLALIPLAALLYGWYRTTLGFRPLDILYAQDSYRFFINPLEGLWINLRYWLAVDPLGVDSLFVGLALGFTALLIRHWKLRHLTLTIYTIAYVLVFLTPINYQYGTDVVTNTQSFARYTLILFPITLLVADWLRHRGKWIRMLAVVVLLLTTLGLSARHVMGILGP